MYINKVKINPITLALDWVYVADFYFIIKTLDCGLKDDGKHEIR